MEDFIKLQQTNLLHRFTAAGLTVKNHTNKRIYDMQSQFDCRQMMLTNIQTVNNKTI
jgi:hypothetical protein